MRLILEVFPSWSDFTILSYQIDFTSIPYFTFNPLPPLHQNCPKELYSVGLYIKYHFVLADNLRYCFSLLKRNNFHVQEDPLLQRIWSWKQALLLDKELHCFRASNHLSSIATIVVNVQVLLWWLFLCYIVNFITILPVL